MSVHETKLTSCSISNNWAQPEAGYTDSATDSESIFLILAVHLTVPKITNIYLTVGASTCARDSTVITGQSFSTSFSTR